MVLFEVALQLDDKEYPILSTLKKKDLEKILVKIFKTGYMIHFPSNDMVDMQVEYNEVLERINSMKDELKLMISNSEVSNKINSLECSLSKLIGLSSNSFKKGNFGENVLEELFSQRYGDITFERKSGASHSGDAWLHLPDNKIIMLESKNYATTINKDEVAKLRADMITHHIRWGIMASFNSMIQGMKELDFYTFTHNNETYSVIMIGNLSSDMHKLDLALQISRKLISHLDNIDNFPWIVEDIGTTLMELNEIVQKNYVLRDNYYNMEKGIQQLLSTYHVTLRDYQYELEKKINSITDKIQETMKESIKEKKIISYDEMLQKYEDKKIFPIVVRFVDLAKDKKWSISYDEDASDWIINRKDMEVGRVKFQLKKATITIPSNDLTLNLHLGKEKENKQNLDIIKSL